MRQKRFLTIKPLICLASLLAATVCSLPAQTLNQRPRYRNVTQERIESKSSALKKVLNGKVCFVYVVNSFDQSSDEQNDYDINLDLKESLFNELKQYLSDLDTANEIIKTISINAISRQKNGRELFPKNYLTESLKDSLHFLIVFHDYSKENTGARQTVIKSITNGILEGAVGVIRTIADGEDSYDFGITCSVFSYKDNRLVLSYVVYSPMQNMRMNILAKKAVDKLIIECSNYK